VPICMIHNLYLFSPSIGEDDVAEYWTGLIREREKERQREREWQTLDDGLNKNINEKVNVKRKTKRSHTCSR